MEIRSDWPFHKATATDTHQLKVIRKVCAACAPKNKRASKVFQLIFRATVDALRKQQNMHAGDSITV